MKKFVTVLALVAMTASPALAGKGGNQAGLAFKGVQKEWAQNHDGKTAENPFSAVIGLFSGDEKAKDAAKTTAK